MIKFTRFFTHLLLLLLVGCAGYQPVTSTGKAIQARLAQCQATPGCTETRLRQGVRAMSVAKALICAGSTGGTCAALSAASLIAKANEVKSQLDEAKTTADQEQQLILDALASLSADEIELAAEAAAES